MEKFSEYRELRAIGAMLDQESWVCPVCSAKVAKDESIFTDEMGYLLGCSNCLYEKCAYELDWCANCQSDLEKEDIVLFDGLEAVACEKCSQKKTRELFEREAI